MAIKELQTRIALKYDSYANWTDETKTGEGANLVLLKGELGICEIKATNEHTKDADIIPTVLFKVGDGEKTFKELPWASAKAADVYAWAKASDLVVEGKSIKFVGVKDAEGNDKKITFNFATPEEVAAAVKVVADDLDDLTTRVANVEAKFTGESSVQGQIDALDGRLDAIENAETGAVATAKAYTNEREVEIKKYADQAEADAKSYADGIVATEKSSREAADSALGERIDAIVKADTGTIAAGDKATLEAAKTYAKDYADGLAGNYDAAGSATTAEANAKKYADDEIAEAVSTQAAKDAAQDSAIEKKLAIDDFNTYINGKSMSDADLKKYAEDEADAAESAAIAAAKTETEKQVKALADGAVAENAAAISAMDEAYKAADTAIKGRLDTVEGKLANVTNVMDFRGAVAALPETADGYQNGDVIVVIDGDNKGKEYVVSDGAFVEFGNTDANAAAISDLQGRMNTAESDIDTAEQDIDNLQAAVATKLEAKTYTDWKATHEADHAKSATAITAEISAAVKVETDRAVGAENAIKDTIGTIAEGKTVAGLIKAAQDQADKGVSDAAAVAGRMTTAEDKISTLEGASHTHANNDELDLIASGDKAKWDDAYAKRHEHANKAELDKIVDGDKAKWDTAATNAGNAVADLAALTGASGRIATAEGKITALQTLTAGFDGTIKDAVDAAKKAGDDAAQAVTDLANGQVKTNKTNIEGHETRIVAIEKDYVKATDLVGDLYIFNCGSATTVTHEQPKA